MKRIAILSIAVALAACQGSEPAQDQATSKPAAAAAPTTDASVAPTADAAAAPAEPSGPMTKPEWFTMDESAKTVNLKITAGATDALNHWNFNGGHNGDMAITVPEGYTINIEFHNNDPAMAHSMGIVQDTGTFGAMMTPDPVFAGAITSNPTSMTDATLPGKSEKVTFTAATPGKYAMVCFIPGHAATGMWIHFDVSSDGSAGVQGAM